MPDDIVLLDRFGHPKLARNDPGCFWGEDAHRHLARETRCRSKYVIWWGGSSLVTKERFLDFARFVSIREAISARAYSRPLLEGTMKCTAFLKARESSYFGYGHVRLAQQIDCHVTA